MKVSFPWISSILIALGIALLAALSLPASAQDANAAPVFTSSPSFLVDEGSRNVGTVVASDSDSQDSVTGYVISGGDDGALFTINSTSGALSFASAPDYDNPSDFNEDNRYVVKVAATSGSGDRVLQASQTITVTVTALLGVVRSDFSLSSDNSRPYGIWGNPETIWVSDEGKGKLFAYRRSDGSRDASRDFNTLKIAGSALDPGNHNPRGLWSDGETMFVTDKNDRKVYAYWISNTSRNPDKDLNLHASHTNAGGIWRNSAGFFWVLNNSKNVLGYFKQSGGVYSTFQINVDNLTSPKGIWSEDGGIMLVAGGGKLNAYRINGGSRDSSRDVTLDSNNSNPAGIWSDGTTIYVVDDADDRVYAYNTKVLVKNTGQAFSPSSSVFNFHTRRRAQTFMTGSNANGYSITSISIRLAGGSASLLDNLEVTLNEVNADSEPGYKVCTLEPPPSYNHLGMNTFHAPPTCLLRANTQYFLLMTFSNIPLGEQLFVRTTDSNSEDGGAASGWSIGDGSHYYQSRWDTNNKSVSIEIKGVNAVGRRPSAPGMPTVTSLTSRRLYVSWDEPSNSGHPIADYDVEYREGSDSQFIDWPHPGHSRSATITGLNPGTFYQVRVRARNSVGVSHWSPAANATAGAFVNNPPVFSGRGNFLAAENGRRVGTLTASDPDPGQNVNAYSISGGSDAALFEITNAGVLSFISAPDFEKPGDANGDNRYTLEIEATGGTGNRALSTQQEITVTVTDVAEKITVANRSSSVLVKNTGIGSVNPLINTDSTGHEFAQKFRTGSHAEGYNVDSVGINFASTGSLTGSFRSPTVTVNEDGLSPGARVCTLSFPSSYQTGVNTFNASDSCRLEANSNYFVLLKTGCRRGGCKPGILTTASSGEDVFAPGWSIGNFFHHYNDVEGTWFNTSGASYMIEIRGTLSMFPSAPAAPTLISPDFGTLYATWSEPANATPPVTGYDVQYREGTSGSFTNWSHTDASRSATITGLKNGTLYEIRVRAINDVGAGNWSPAGNHTTADAPVNHPPQFSSSSSFSVFENSLSVGTVTAFDSNGEDIVTGYNISGGDDAALFEINATSGALSFISTPDYESPGDADGDRRHVLTVTATSGTGSRILSSEQSITVRVTNVPELPSAPAAPVLSSNVPSVLLVRWLKPDNTGPPITQYRVDYREGRSGSFNDSRYRDKERSARITSLKASTEYQVRVRAINSDGFGNWSPLSTHTTADAASNLSVVVNICDRTVKVRNYILASLNNVACDNMTLEQLQKITFISLSNDPGVTSFKSGDFDNLTMLTTLSIQNVENLNSFPEDVFDDLYSLDALTILTFADIGSLPDGIFDNLAGLRTLFLRHNQLDSLPDDVFDNLSSLQTLSLTSNFNLTTLPEGVFENLTSLSDLSTDFGCIPAAAFGSRTDNLSEIEHNGNPLVLCEDFDNLTNNPPAFSTGDSFSVKEGRNRVIVEVRADDEDILDSVTGYRISGGDDAALFMLYATTGALIFREIRDFEKDGDTEFVVEITVTSGTGDREMSATKTITVTVTDVDEPPSAPSRPSVSSLNSTSLSVSWSEPSNTGPEITDYDVQYREDSSSTFLNLTHEGTARSATLTGLSENTTYDVRVRASNDEGTGGWSQVTNATTASAPTADVPSGPVIINITSDLSDNTHSPFCAGPCRISPDQQSGRVPSDWQGIIPIKVVFNESVNVTGAPALNLTGSGNFIATAEYTSGNGTDTLVFSYAIPPPPAPEIKASNLNVSGLDLPTGAAIKNAANQNASLTLPSGANLDDNKNIHIDSTPPPLSVRIAPGDSNINSPGIGENPDGSGRTVWRHNKKYWFRSSYGWNRYTWVYPRILMDNVSACDASALAGKSNTDRNVNNIDVARYTTESNGKRYCSSVADAYGNRAFALAYIRGIDRVRPEITVGNLTSGNKVSATASDPGCGDRTDGHYSKCSGINSEKFYALPIDGETGCDADAYSNVTSLNDYKYANNTEIEVPEGRKICFQVNDNVNVGNRNDRSHVAYAESGVFAVVIAPTIEITPGAGYTTPKQSITITASSSDGDVDNASWKYKIIADTDTCDSDEMANGANSGSSVTLNQESQNNHKVCFAVTNSNNNTGYGASGVVSGIDRTAPAISVSAVTDNRVFATVSDNLDNAPAFESQILTSGSCNSGTAGTFTAYTAGTILTLAAGEKACFKATDDAGNVAFADSSLSNSPPVFSSNAAFTVAENAAEVGTVVASDSDSGDSVTGYTISGGADRFSFSLVSQSSSGAVLAFVQSRNFESPSDADGNNQYVVQVKATSGSGSRVRTATQSITVTVRDVDEPPSATSAPVLSSPSSTSLSVSWSAPGNTGPPIDIYYVQYRQGSSGSFSNWPHTGNSTSTTITSLTASTLYEVRVRAGNAEGNSSWSQTANFTTGSSTPPPVTNVVPVFTSSSSFSVNENSRNVGTVVASDGDSQDSVTGYSISGGVDSARFSITGGGVLTFDSAPNFESAVDVGGNNIYDIVVTATSGTGTRVRSATQSIVVSVDDVNESPSTPSAPVLSSSTSSSLSVTWSAPLNTGPVITDYDVQYRQGTTGSFSNQSHTGTSRSTTITGLTASTAYQVRVRASNAEGTSGWSQTSSFSTGSSSPNQVTNNAPVFTSRSSFFVNENVRSVGTVVASDGDSQDSVTGYRIAGGVDSAFFELNSSSGALSFKSVPDYESSQDSDNDNEYLVEVTATSGSGSRELSAVQTITVTVTDVNEMPAISSSQTFSVNENELLAGEVVASDQDNADDVTGYNVSGGDDAALFEINATGMLSFRSAPNYETAADNDNNNDYLVQITVTSGTGSRETSASQTITVTVTDVDEVPSDPPGVLLSSLSSSSLFVLWLEPANTGPPITVYDVQYRKSANTSFANWSHLDNSTSTTITGLSGSTSYDVRVRARNDEGIGSWSSVQGYVTSEDLVDIPQNINDPPVFSSGNFSVDENSVSVGAVVASDFDSQDNVTGYGISGGVDSALFEINVSSGVLSFVSAPDFERPGDNDTDNDYIVEVTVTSGAGDREMSAVQLITVTVADVDEPPSAPAAPSLSSLNSTSLLVEWSEPDDSGHVITDYDVEYREGSTGNFTGWPHSDNSTSTTITTDLAPDTAYEVRVLARNAEGESDWSDAANVTTPVTVVNNPPTFRSSSSFPVDENVRSVGTVVASDSDGQDSVTGYSISGGADASLFSIADDGVLSFVSAPDFEKPSDSNRNNLYLVNVEATSGTYPRNKSAEQRLLITVTDANEPPSTPSPPTLSFPTSDSLTVTWVAPDDSGHVITDYDVEYREGSTGNFTGWPHADNSTSTTITTDLAPDTAYEVRVLARNAEGDSNWSDTASATTVAVINNPPEFSGSPAFSVEENNLSAGTVMASDSDGSDGITGYRISGDDAALFRITNAGVLTFVSAPDFENPDDSDDNNQYLLTVNVTSGTGSRILSAEQEITVNVTDVDEPPSAPSVPILSSPTSTSLFVTWVAPSNTGPEIIDYDVQYSQGSNGSFLNQTHDDASTNATITHLETDTFYGVRVRASNDEGTGDWSQVSNATTGAVVNNHPGFLSSPAFSVNENNVTVGTVVADDVDNLDSVTGYTISGGDDAALFTINNGALSFVSPPDSETPGDADRNNQYVLQVAAVSGTGDRFLSAEQSIIVTVTNVNEPPSAPEAPKLNSTTSTSIDVTWSVPDNKGPSVSDYDVEYREGSTGNFTDWPHADNSTSTTITTDLAPDTAYEVRVLARNAEGESDWSDAANVTTPVTVVNAPPEFSSRTVFEVHENGVGVGTVVASDPDSQDDVTGYGISGGADTALFSITDEGVLTFVSAPDFEDPEDSNGNNYYLLEVTAVSGTDERVLSEVQFIIVRVVNVKELPSAPEAPKLNSTTSTSIDVTWSVHDNSGPEITDYDVEYREGDSGPFTDWPHSGASTGTVITDLEFNATYEVRVRAWNSDGNSSWSPTTGTIVGGINNPPEFSGSPAFSAGENNLTAGTVAVDDADAVDNVTGYVISGGDDAALFTITNAGVLAFVSAPDFENPDDSDDNNQYLLTVNVTSGTGSRILSAEQEITVNVTDLNEPPSAPARPALNSPTYTSITVRWLEPDNSGPVITDYDVEYREGSTGNFTDWPHAGTSTSTTITSLNSNTAYEVQVRASNDEGTGDWSQVATINTGAPSSLPAVSTLIFSDVVQTEAGVNVILSNHGNVNRTVRLRYRASDSIVWSETLTMNASTGVAVFRLTGLSPGKPHVVQASLDENFEDGRQSAILNTASLPPGFLLLSPADGNFSGSVVFNASYVGPGIKLMQFGYVNSTDGTVTWFNGTEGPDGFWSATLDTSGLADGSYDVSLRITDLSDTVEVSDNVVLLFIDNSAPEFSLVSPSAGDVSAVMRFNVSANDVGSGVRSVQFGYVRSGTSRVTWIDGAEGPDGFWSAELNTTAISDGSYDLSVHVVDFAGAENLALDFLRVVVDNVPDRTTSSGSGSGSSRSSRSINVCSGVSGLPGGASQSRIWSGLGAGSVAEFRLSNSGIPVSVVEFNARRPLTNLGVVVSGSSSLPSGASGNYEGTLYRYFSINGCRLDENSVSSMTFSFGVNRSFVSENGASGDDVVLLRHDNGQWNRAALLSTGSNAERYFYESGSEGFSSYAIVLRKSPGDDGSDDAQDGSGDVTSPVVDVEIVNENATSGHGRDREQNVSAGHERWIPGDINLGLPEFVLLGLAIFLTLGGVFLLLQKILHRPR